MINPADSAKALVELIQRKAPEYLDLLVASSDQDFEQAFDAVLAKAVDHLQSNSRNFHSLDEEGLSGVLAASLSIPGLSITQETHSNGHVDLTIVADHCTPVRKKLCEAKIYNGPRYHIEGLKQLLTRYTTGTEGRGLLIVYFRKANIAGLTQKIREQMDLEFPCNQQGPCQDYTLKWSFLSLHDHVCGERLEVSHVGCNLCID